MSETNFKKISTYISNFSDEIQKYNLDELFEKIVEKMSYQDKIKIIEYYGGLTKAYKNYGDHFNYLDYDDFEENYVENYLTLKIFTECFENL